MSGGSMDYAYNTIERYARDLEDRELIELALDMAQLFRDKEWFDSGDTGVGEWNKSVLEFKNKWLRNNSNQRTEEMIINACDALKDELLKAFAHKNFCKDCKNFECREGSMYGNCPLHKGCLMHKYECCEEFEER